MIYAYIFVMAGVTYLIRMLPLTLFQKKITNVYIRSFLYYVPYAVLAAMTLPGILYSCNSSVFLLHSCVCYGENFIISVKKT